MNRKVNLRLRRLLWVTFFVYSSICVCIGNANASSEESEVEDENALSAELQGDIVTRNGDEFSIGELNTNSVNESVNNGTTEANGRRYKRDPAKVASVIVYFLVVLLGIFGILIKYFVTQYETLQAKAQLEYQQLSAVKTSS